MCVFRPGPGDNLPCGDGNPPVQPDGPDPAGHGGHVPGTSPDMLYTSHHIYIYRQRYKVLNKGKKLV